MARGGVRRSDIFGRSSDGTYYPIPLTTSGTAMAVYGSITTQNVANSSYEFGQVSLTGGTATSIPISMTATRSILLQAHLNNSQTIYIGGSASSITGIQLAAGDSITFDYDDSTTGFFGFCSSTSLINYAAFK